MRSSAISSGLQFAGQPDLRHLRADSAGALFARTSGIAETGRANLPASLSYPLISSREAPDGLQASRAHHWGAQRKTESQTRALLLEASH